MGQFIFDQLSFARQGLLNAVKEVTESQADIVPAGFNNSIRWNLGHVSFTQDRYAFDFAGEPMGTPEGYSVLFANGTRPSEWKINPPTLPEIIEVLQEQPSRIREKLQDRLNEPIANPVIRGNLSLRTFDELLTFTLFHEGQHLQTIRTLIKLTSK